MKQKIKIKKTKTVIQSLINCPFQNQIIIILLYYFQHGRFQQKISMPIGLTVVEHSPRRSPRRWSSHNQRSSSSILLAFFPLTIQCINFQIRIQKGTNIFENIMQQFSSLATELLREEEDFCASWDWSYLSINLLLASKSYKLNTTLATRTVISRSIYKATPLRISKEPPLNSPEPKTQSNFY